MGELGNDSRQDGGTDLPAAPSLGLGDLARPFAGFLLLCYIKKDTHRKELWEESGVES